MNGQRFFNHEEKETLLINQDFMCGECGEDLWGDHIGANPAHHILPTWAGGETVIENGVILCHACHVLWDNRAVIGEFYPGGYNLADFEEEQIADEKKYYNALEKICENKKRGLKIK